VGKNLRKVLLFSYFIDTVDWIEDRLCTAVETDSRLADYQGQVVSVSSTAARGDVSRETAAFGFAPDSTEAPSGRDAYRVDILITTNVPAEGANLQQFAHIINYDLPWNPMRLV
jgi:hypothetical protein